MNDFQENILDHYKNPKNFGKPEWQSTSTFSSANVSCGDEIKIYINSKDNHINNLAFEGEGCSISIASASIITEEMLKMSSDELNSLSDDDFIDKYLGIKLTNSRRKCALLAFNAIKNALKDS